MNSKKVVLVFLLIFIFGSRLIALDARVLHHDEGVNYFFAKNIVSGVGWKYDPLNYHGPLYFFILALSFLVFGVSEFSLRFPAAAAGIALASLPLFLRWGEWKERWMASVFLLLSPSVLYYSRYSIHESNFVLFSFLAIYFFSRIVEQKDLEWLPFFAVCLALLFTIKETVIILGVAIFFMILFYYRNLKEIKYREEIGTLAISLFLFILIYVAFFTNFFSYRQGFFDSFKSYAPWTDRGMHEVGHDKAFYYYFWTLLIPYELPLLVLGFFGLLYAWRDGRIFAKNCVIWFLTLFVVYSFIPYKTPWLVINLVVPLCFLAVWGFYGLYRWNPRVMGIVFIITIWYLLFFSYRTSVAIPWQKENSFAYVHTYQGVLDLVKEVDAHYSPGEPILIYSNEYWPLPFYFDSKNVSYVEEKNGFRYEDFSQYGFFIVRDTVFDETLVPQGFTYTRYSLREGVNLWLVRAG